MIVEPNISHPPSGFLHRQDPREKPTPEGYLEFVACVVIVAIVIIIVIVFVDLGIDGHEADW